MKKHKFWTCALKKDAPEDAEPLASMWVPKKKSNGNARGRLNAHGFKQKRNVHYKENNIAHFFARPFF